MEEREQPFAAFVLATLMRRSAELGQWWAERAQLGAPENEEQGAEVVRTLLDGANGPIVRVGWTIGTAAHRRDLSLHQLHEGLDLLTTALLEAAGDAAGEYAGTTARDGLELARRIVAATSVLRVAACSGYTQAVEDELRERYRAIRHDLRNPLGTLKSAIALLTDETLPVDMRQSSHMRALAVRNARSLDRIIGEALGDDAARLNAFETPRELTTQPLAGSPADLSADPPAPDVSSAPSAPGALGAPSAPGGGASGREQREDVPRARQRPDLESGAL